MTMYNPPYPGEFIKETYLDPFGVSQNEIAEKLDISPSTFNRLIRGHHRVSPEMAIRLSKVLGRSPESWMAMQNLYDLYLARSDEDQFSNLERFDFLSIPNQLDEDQRSTFT
jgi:addiction module HigA family antidote